MRRFRMVLSLLLGWHAAAGAAGVEVRAFELEGKPSPERLECLAEISGAYVGRRMNTDALQALRLKLTRHCYLDQGYVNSGVLLPDQDVENGVIRLRVVEGVLTAVQPQGNKSLSDEFLRERIGPGLSHPLSLTDLKQEILLLERHPLIDGLDARLLPGDRPGESRLQLGVRENSPYRLSFALDNYRRSPSVGAEHFSLQAQHLSVSGRGDRLDLQLGATEGSRDAGLYYDLPFTQRTSLTAYAEYSDSVVIETVFEPLDIESDYFTVGLGLRRTLLRTLDDTLWMSLGFAHKNSNSRLLGEGFSFSPGVSDGESRIAMVSFSQQWSHRSVRDRRVDAAWLLHSRFTLGIDALDATVHDGLPDGRFLTWQGHAQWRKRLDQNGRRQLAVRGRVQLADSPLLPLEKFTLGGVDTVRGYRENTLVRDNGWSLSLELYWTLSPPGSSWGEWQLVPFIDYGDGWNEGPLELNQELGSVGAGLIWNGPGGWYAELYGAARLVDVGNGGDDLQDQGVYFQVRYEAF